MKKTALILTTLLILAAATQAATIISTDNTYVRSGAADSNLSSEDRILVGWHSAGTLVDMRGVFQFDLSSITDTITSVTLTVTKQSFTNGDQESGIFGLELKNMGETFDETTVTWNSLTPDGGNLGTTLSTVAGYNASVPAVGAATVFNSSAAFVSAAQAAADGSDLFSLILYSPGAEAHPNVGTSPRSFYRFNESATLTVTTIPEPSAFAMVLGGLGLLQVMRRRRA